jgi:outer membrane protein OmpA-like peptidoglycan-associated protein
MTTRAAEPRIQRRRDPHAALQLGLVAAFSLTVLASPREASAQDEFAIERFHPAPAGDRFFGLPSPYVAGDFDLHAALLADYGYEPLALNSPPADAESRVSYQTVFHADLTLTLNQRVLLNFDIPALAIQGGEAAPALHRVDFGDIRLGGRVRLVGENATPFQLGLGGYLWLPSATGATTGDGAVRGMPYLSAGGLVGRVLWTALVGSEFRPHQRYLGAVDEGISFNVGAGFGYLVDEQRKLQLGVESALSFVFSEPSSRNLNAELLFDGRYRFLDRFEAGVAVGPGLSSGVGTPGVRAVVLLAYVPVADLTPPSEQLRRENPPVAADTLLDRAIHLSNLRSLPVDPRCCAASLPASNEARERELLKRYDSILFDPGSAEIGPRAERAIHAIADYLILHPEIRKIELRGHADIHGTLQGNERLGARRAEAVKHALVRHSVAPERLVTSSYGPTEPAASNTTAEGMRLNRRVVIRILEPADQASPVR